MRTASGELTNRIRLFNDYGKELNTPQDNTKEIQLVISERAEKIFSKRRMKRVRVDCF